VGIHEGFQTFTGRELTNIPMALPIYLAFDLQKHSRDFLSSPLKQTLVNTINGDGNVGCIRTGEVRPALTDMISTIVVPPTKIWAGAMIIIAINIFVVLVVTHVCTQIKHGVNHVVVNVFNTSHERIDIFLVFIIHDEALYSAGDR
jgi:hypothetical protein